MTFVLPVQVAGGAASWTLSDWRTVRLSATADATGAATLSCGQIDPLTQWLVDRIVITTSGTATPAVAFYDTTVAPAALLDVTASGKTNTADYPNGLLIRPTGELLARWTGATPGAACTLAVQIRVLRVAG